MLEVLSCSNKHGHMSEEGPHPGATTLIYNFRIDSVNAPQPSPEFEEQERLFEEEKKLAAATASAAAATAAASEMSQEHPAAPASTTAPTDAEAAPSKPPAKKRRVPASDPDRRGSDTRTTVLLAQLAPTAPGPYMARVTPNITEILTKEYKMCSMQLAVLEAAAGLTPSPTIDEISKLEKVSIRGGITEFYRAMLRPLLTGYFSEMPAHARSSGGTHNSAADYYAADKRVTEGLSSGAFSPLEQAEFNALKELENRFCSVGRTDASFGREDRKKKAAVKDKAAEDAEKLRLSKQQDQVMDGGFRAEKLAAMVSSGVITKFLDAEFAGEAMKPKRDLAEYMLGLDQEFLYNILATVAEEEMVAKEISERAKAKEAYKVKHSRDGAGKKEHRHKRPAPADPVYQPVTPQEIS